MSDFSEWLGSVDHIAFAIREVSLVSSLEGIFGKCVHFEEVPHEGVKVWFFPLGDILVEALLPIDSHNTVARFLQKRNARILFHHIAFRVKDINVTMEELKKRGIRFVRENARTGARGYLVNFIHPSSTGGVLVEICQPPL